MPALPPRPGRHRHLVLAPGRFRRMEQTVGWLGSVLALASLAVLGVAVAATLTDAAGPPTVTVTFDGDR